MHRHTALQRRTWARASSCAVVWIALLSVACGARAENAPAPPPEQPELSVELNDAGAISILYGGTQLVEDGRWNIENVYLRNASGDVSKADLKDVKVDVNRDARTIKYSWAWGEFVCAYSIKGERLDATVTLTNRSDQAIASVEMTLFTFKFPKTPSNFVYPPVEPNIGGPTVLRADYGSGNVVICNEDFLQRLHVGIPFALNREKTIYSFVVDTGRRPRFADFFALIDRRIYPGCTDTYHVSLRFGPAGATEKELAGDVFERYRQCFPFKLNWPDRRPIGALFLSSSETKGKPGNPRGWFLDKTIDVTTAEGRDAFKTRLMKFAENSIVELVSNDAQGVIVWDLEGQEFPHATSYLGDPRSLPPEMEPLADEFLAKLKSAGLKIGVCVRPQLPVRHPYDNDVHQTDVRNIFENLNEKIDYAIKRWGCSIFYVDSDVDHDVNGRIIHDAQIFRKLTEAHPDVLLIPEHAYPQHYAYTAPYKELRLGFTGTPENALRVYPEAFSVIYVADGPIDEKRGELIQAVKRGDILLFRGWWPDPFNAKMKSIYDEAKKR